MTGTFWRRAAVVLPLLLAPVVAPQAQSYFGRNKVQYETFPWKILQSDHFDNFFYPAESLHVFDAARMAERWYERHSTTFRHAFDRKSLIFYADHPDFEQTNVVGEQLEEGTGGVTEGVRTRVIMPFTGVYSDDDHVLGHELVHVFQYNIAEGAPQGGLARIDALPLWLIEGMAEYFSLGRHDPLTAMWMRDAVMRNKFPTIKQLTTDPRFFPYRYGQALWAYVGGRWGDRAIVDVYRNALRVGWDQSLVRSLGESSDSLSKDWAASNKAMYAPQLVGRTHPDSIGEEVVKEHRSGEYNISPTVSPDGNMVAFFSSRSLFSIDLFVADAHTGKVIKKLAGPQSDSHIDALSFVNAAGDWSPDGSQFAFIVYAEGNNELALLDVKSGKIERRISVPTVGAILSVSWSPDGKTLAFSGQQGGMSDLFTLDLASGVVKQLTHDRYADLQPTWSPDGKTLAFVTDRGPNTDFGIMKFGALSLATYDLATGAIREFAPFPNGKHINPQYSPDGQELFFVSDQDGIPDLYRLHIATGEVFRLTKVATGVSGITTLSPAISVARKTGRLLFTVFYDQGHSIRAFEPSQLTGTPMALAPTDSTGSNALQNTADAAVLPPGPSPQSPVVAYLHDPQTGLPSGADFSVHAYHPSFQLDALGQPSVGVGTTPFGTGISGGVSAYFGDQLSDQQLMAAIQANGTVKDIGGAFYYQNLRKRWNYGFGVQHIPYLTGGIIVQDAGSGYTEVDQVLQRIYVDQASYIAQYPFSQTRRFEFNASATRLGFEQEVQALLFDPNGNQVDRASKTLPSPKAMFYAQPTAAFVGDNTFSGFTSPVAGTRWRVEGSPVFGTVTFQSLLADYRRYFFAQPFTLATRILHYGRYGRDADNAQLSPIYLGDETLIRGYGYGSFSADECKDTTGNSCPVFDRLFGSRVIVANMELRIPLFGTSEFGLINFPYLPTEISPFFDAGLAYAGNQSPDWRFTQSNNTPAPASCSSQPSGNGLYLPIPCADRVPVFSTGVSARFNVLGYMILEAYLAHPFQRPGKSWVTGFQLAPGW